MSASPQAPCSHLLPGPYPFESVLVLDDHLGPTDWLVRCRSCGVPYLFEMLDWADALRLYRLRLPDEAAANGLMRDLDRGSCDLNRATAQAQHFSLSSKTLPLLVLLDMKAGELVSVSDAPHEEVLPTSSWRELPCDGRWIGRLLSASD